MTKDIIKRFFESATIQAILQRADFDPEDSVTLTLTRDDPDWAGKLSTMRQFCEDNCHARYRASAPINSDTAIFEFERGTEALHFKLRFG